MTQTLYSWSFDWKRQRWNLWYIIIISIAIWLIIWWFINKIYWLSFVIMILAWLMYFIENNSPDKINVVINELWIQVWTTFYDFWDISSFTIIYDKSTPYMLRLNLTKKGLKHLDLYITPDNATQIKNTLLNFTQENWKEDLSFIEKMTRLLKL